MLLGEYEHTLDDKNRLTLPARFRQALADGVVVARGMDGCLVVYTRAGWDEFVAARLQGLNQFSKEARQMSRFIVRGAGCSRRPSSSTRNLARRSSSRASGITSRSGTGPVGASN